MHAVRKYLETWAEPEIGLAAGVAGAYDRCLVVPACREEASLLDGYAAAAATSRGRTLCILVVNGREDAPSEHHAENAALLADLENALCAVRRAPIGFMGSYAQGALDVFVVDRASVGTRFPKKAGVGLARKIGMDLALALRVAQKVRSELIFCTDADATLPEAHFDHPEDVAKSAGAVVFPFWHDRGGDGAVSLATALYELRLRYYFVAGLRFAGSPYAFHTLGSAMAVGARAYAAVRGTPRRQAGEDFYLLGKIAKVAAVIRAAGPAVRIRARASDRTPFGTGAGVSRALGDRPRGFYAPETFVALSDFVRALEVVAEEGASGDLKERHAGLCDGQWEPVRRALFDAGAAESFASALRHAPTREARRARAHEWFDAFRTLKFVHALRRSVHPDVPWQEAVTGAAFVPEASRTRDLDAVRAALFDAEARSPAVLGPGAPRVGATSPARNVDDDGIWALGSSRRALADE